MWVDGVFYVMEDYEFQKRAGKINDLVTKIGSIKLYTIFDSLGISPRMWESERGYFLEKYPNIGYDKKNKCLYPKIKLKSKQEVLNVK